MRYISKELKKHYKMYKSGKLWIIAGISTLSFFISSNLTIAKADTYTLGSYASSGQDSLANVKSVDPSSKSLPESSTTFSSDNSSFNIDNSNTSFDSNISSAASSNNTSLNSDAISNFNIINTTNSNDSKSSLDQAKDTSFNSNKLDASNNSFAYGNSIYSKDDSSITTDNGFLTANSWYRPKAILKDGNTWTASNEKDFRPLLMVWWPNKQIQINYLNYMRDNNLGNNDYSNNSTSQDLANGALDVQRHIEQKIFNSNGDVNWLKNTMSKFIDSQPIWNMDSESYNSSKDFFDGFQGGFLLYGNNKLTPYANSNYRLLNRGDGQEFLLGNDVDNSNPVVQAEDLNWLHYMMNIGSITKNDSNANFDGVRMDAIGDMDSDVLNIFSNYFRDAYGINLSDKNANSHLSILEDWNSGNGHDQLFTDYGTTNSAIDSLSKKPDSRGSLSSIINGSWVVNRSNDFTYNQVAPNYTFVHAHDSGVQDVLANIIKDKIDPNGGLTSDKDEVDRALQYYNDDLNSTNKQYTYYNVPALYALLLTNKDTVPRVYYGDMYVDNAQYMAQPTIYYNSIKSLLTSRVKYVAGGQSMHLNNNVLTSVRYGKNANTPDDMGDSSTRNSGIAVVESNNDKLANTQVTINMGAAHKNQAYRPLLLSTDDGINSYDSDESAKDKVIYTDNNGILTLDASQVKGYSNPQVSGYVSAWVPVGASENQDVRTSPSDSKTTDGNSFHSNSALDSNVIFESFSSFQPIPTDNDQYLNVILNKKASELKKLGFTSIEFPPLYRSTNDNSFLDEVTKNGYAFSDRYDLGYGTPTKYGTIDQLTDALKSLHSQGIQAMTDIVANQIYGLNGSEVVSATRVNSRGDYIGNSDINKTLYYANTVGGGEYQKKYGGEFLDDLKSKYPDLFSEKQVSTNQPIDSSVKIKQWSAKYLNGTNIQGRGSGYVLKDSNNNYFMVGDSTDTNLPSQLLYDSDDNSSSNSSSDGGSSSADSNQSSSTAASIAASKSASEASSASASTANSIAASKSASEVASASASTANSVAASKSASEAASASASTSTANSVAVSKSASEAASASASTANSVAVSKSASEASSASASTANSIAASKLASEAASASASTANSIAASKSASEAASASASTANSIAASKSASEAAFASSSTANSIVASKSASEAASASASTANSTAASKSASEAASTANSIAASKSASEATSASASTANSIAASSKAASEAASASASTANSIAASKSAIEASSKGSTSSSNSSSSPSTSSSTNSSSSSSTSNSTVNTGTTTNTGNTVISTGGYVAPTTTTSSSSSSATSSASSSATSSVASSTSSIASSVASSSSATSSSSSVDGGSNVNSAGDSNKAKDAMIKAQDAVKVAEKLKNQTHSKAHVKNYNNALDNYYRAEKQYLKVAKLYNSKYYYDFDKVTKHSKYVKLSKSAYVYDSKKFNEDNRVSKVKKGTKVKVNKIVRDGKTTRFNIGHNKFITGLKSFIHKLSK